MAVPQATAPDLIRDHEASRMLDMSTKTLANQRSRGEGPPFVRLGRTIRYSRKALEAWIESQQVGGAA